MKRSAVLVALSATVMLGGCRGIGPRDLAFPVGSCIQWDEGIIGTVACSTPHTHTVLAIVAANEVCPNGTSKQTDGLDPHARELTWCLRADD